jgi:hypothetical protein
MNARDSEILAAAARRQVYGDPERRAGDAPTLDKAMEVDRMSTDANANANQAQQSGQAPQQGQAPQGQQPQSAQTGQAQAPQGQAQAQPGQGQAGQLSDAEQQQFTQAAQQLHARIQSHGQGQGQAPAGAQANVATDFLTGLVNAARNVTPEQIRAVLTLARLFGVSIPGL